MGATTRAYRGEIDTAFEWLDRAYEQREPLMAWIKLDPLLNKLQGDPRLHAMLEKMNLADSFRRLTCIKIF